MAQIVSASEFLSNVVSSIRIKEGMEDEALVSHILYVASQKNTASAKNGARAIVALLLESGAIQLADGKYKVSTAAHVAHSEGEPAGREETHDDDATISKGGAAGSPLKPILRKRAGSDSHPNITISINRHSCSNTTRSLFRSPRTWRRRPSRH